MKAVSVIVKVTLVTVAVFLGASIALMFLPNATRNAITLFSLQNAKTVIFAITSIIFVLYLYRPVININQFTRAKRVGLAIVTLFFWHFSISSTFAGSRLTIPIVSASTTTPG